MGAFNPLIEGGMPMPIAPMNPAGAQPVGGGAAPKASLGSVGGSLMSSGKGSGEPTAVAGLVLAAAAVIILVHLAGVRTRFAVSAGRG